MGHFQTLLEGIVANPEQKISSLPLLTDTERRQLLVEWNDTRTDYPNQETIQELFVQQVSNTPDAAALICTDRQVTYRELNSRANQLAHYLIKRGVRPDTRVGLCVQRSPEMIMVLLGILKAGCAYVPLGCAWLGELGQGSKRFQVITLWLTAGLFHLMVDNHLDDLQGGRQLLAGGDVLSVPRVQKVLAELKGCRLINGYGPTENPTFTCCHAIDDPDGLNGSVPIGRPISNTSVYILDASMNPVPVGVRGELYIGGDGVARGYLDLPGLNAERFVLDPVSQTPGACLYRTGDLVRYRASGEIEFIGRMDNQVKVRGFRIELGEIESALAEHPTVREAAVIARKDNGDKHLAAYLVPAAGMTVSMDDLREFLKGKLPDHMVPSVFVTIESLPLSPSGKVDRRALPSTNEA